jgi:hypothetical protein
MNKLLFLIPPPPTHAAQYVDSNVKFLYLTAKDSKRSRHGPASRQLRVNEDDLAISEGRWSRVKGPILR